MAAAHRVHRFFQYEVDEHALLFVQPAVAYGTVSYTHLDVYKRQVHGGGRQNTEIPILQIFRNWFAARSCHTHCMKEQHGRIPPVAILSLIHICRRAAH